MSRVPPQGLATRPKFAEELALAGFFVDETRVLPGIIRPVGSIAILTSSESYSSSTPTVTSQKTIWRGSLINMDRIKKVEVEVDWESAGSGKISLYNVTDGEVIADLDSPSSATSRDTRYYDVTDKMKSITSDKVIALQITGDGSNAVTVYKAQIIIYMSLG